MKELIKKLYTLPKGSEIDISHLCNNNVKTFAKLSDLAYDKKNNNG